MERRNRNNYVVPLGEHRNPVTKEVDEAWQFIHDERVRRGLAIEDIGRILDRNITTSMSKGERGEPISIQTTRLILRLLGYKLILVPLEASDVDETA